MVVVEWVDCTSSQEVAMSLGLLKTLLIGHAGAGIGVGGAIIFGPLAPLVAIVAIAVMAANSEDEKKMLPAGAKAPSPPPSR